MDHPTVIPLYGFLAGDCLGLVILVPADAKVGAIATTLIEAAITRVAPLARPAVFHAGKRLDLELAIAASGIAPLDRIDVREAP